MSSEIKALQQKILKYNQQYRDGELSITDSEFDALLDKLECQMDQKAFNTFRDSLHEVPGTVKHPYVMGSLNKIKSTGPKKLSDFIQNHIPVRNGVTTLHVSAKIDGISCRLQYRGGKLRGAYTRGDGYFGQDITNKAKYWKHAPQEIKSDLSMDIRGELVITKADFSNITTRDFKNPRNACAGIINRKEENPDGLCEIVSFIAYEIMGQQTLGRQKQFDILKTLGFKTAYHYKDAFKNDGDIMPTVNSLVELLKQDFEYEVDGFVIADPEYRIETDKYRPEGIVAFKDDDMVAITKIISIDWRGPSKDGKYIPVAFIEPVELGGATISRVTCHNLDYIDKRGLKIGSMVTIVKSGDIIPKILNVLDNGPNTTAIHRPEVCRECLQPLVVDGCDLRCPNVECSDREATAVANFLRRLGIENVAKQTLGNWGITTFKDLLEFNHPEGSYFQSKIDFCKALIPTIFEKSEKELLTNLNFEGLSVKTLTKMIDFYGIENLRNKNFSKGFPKGVGKTTVENFCAHSDRNFEILDMFMKDPRYSAPALDNQPSSIPPQNGKRVCFTGALDIPRAEVSRLAKNCGYLVDSGVTRSLNILVCPDPDNSNSSKTKKAREYGIEIMSSKDFFKLIQK